MISMMVIIDKAAREDDVEEIVDIMLNKYKESMNLTSSTTAKNYITKKALKKKYDEYIKSTPVEFLNEYKIDSFEKYLLEYWNIIGFVGEDPVIAFNPNALFEFYEITDIFRRYDVDDYDIVSDIDYLLNKDGILYELEDASYLPIGFIKILKKCNHNDYIVMVSCQD